MRCRVNSTGIVCVCVCKFMCVYICWRLTHIYEQSISRLVLLRIETTFYLQKQPKNCQSEARSLVIFCALDIFRGHCRAKKKK